MLPNLPIVLFGISLIFCLLCLFLCFADMHYAEFIIAIVYFGRNMIMIGMKYEFQEQLNIIKAT